MKTLKFAILTFVVLGLAAAPSAFADEQAGETSSLSGKVERVDLRHHTMRIGGKLYDLPSDVEAVDIREGGPTDLRYLRRGSRVMVRIKPGKNRPVIDYIEVRDMPLK